MNDIGLVSLKNVVCQVGIRMPGAAAALTTEDNGVYVDTEVWRAGRDLILQELSDLPIVRPDWGWSLLIDTAALRIPSDEASRKLFEKAQIAASPMTGWLGPDRAGRYLRFVYSNKRVERLRGIRERLRAAWAP